jgi:type IV secretion system protein VirB6
MACPAIITGDSFLLRVLTHIDCQAQVIGSYGYQALGQPGSTASVMMTSLLTLFIALFGIRLLFGPPPGARDLVFDVLKIGIVMTLAFSWPAFRTVIYDVTLKGPADVATVIAGASGNEREGEGLAQRLQRADNAIVRLTEVGTGRNLGALIDKDAPGGTFDSAALADDTAFGSARLLYLASTIGTLALLRIAAGLLLAVTPLVAGMLFFPWTRGLVAGWIKGLVLTMAGSIGTAIVLSVELAIIETWLADALKVRSLGYAIPAAPTELFAIMLAFAIVQLMMIWLLARVVFIRGWLSLPDWPRIPDPQIVQQTIVSGRGAPGELSFNRAEQVSNAVETVIRREQTQSSDRFIRTPLSGMNEGSAGAAAMGPASDANAPRLGNSYRRTSLRSSRAGQARDRS